MHDSSQDIMMVKTQEQITIEVKHPLFFNYIFSQKFVFASVLCSAKCIFNHMLYSFVICLKLRLILKKFVGKNGVIYVYNFGSSEYFLGITFFKGALTSF